MTAEEIRIARNDVTKIAQQMAAEKKSVESVSATLLLHVFGMLAEIAAQLAEMNAYRRASDDVSVAQDLARGKP